MASYLMNSKHNPAKIMRQARDFFGPDGTGLDIKTEYERHLLFRGGGGYILLQVSEAGTGSQVELETREWDFPVRQFMEKYS